MKYSSVRIHEPPPNSKLSRDGVRGRPSIGISPFLNDGFPK
jgi:hypothetical protein